MLNSLQNTWNGLSLIQRAALGGVLAAAFGALMWVTQTASRTSYGILFSNLEPNDAGAVTAKLREMNVEYRLSHGGRAIEVPAEKVYDLRLSLASEGLPSGGNIGFEIFDRTSFGATQFTQHLNFQRALQGELTRTINRLDGVVESRIHLAIPDRPLFAENEEPVTASVVLHLRPGYHMDGRRVAGIVHLVSSAVEGLQPENVTVHDAQGELLSSAESPSMLSGGQLQLQEQFERRLESQLSRLAEQVVGPGKAAIQVSADLNWDQTETTREEYAPGGLNGRNLPVEEQSTTESYGPGGYRPAEGPPGTTSNLQPPAIPRGTTEETRNYNNTQTNNRYAVNKVVERRITAPGKIRRLSIAVLLDADVGAEKQQALKTAFAAAAGLDLTPVARGGRGDQIELLPMAFDKTRTTEATRAADAAASQSFRMELIRNGAAVLIVLVVFIATLILSKRLRSPRREPLDTLITEALPLDTTYRALGSQPQPISEAPPAPALPERVRQLASERPDDVARQLQAWMAE
jgi:flagellar M-ring protein FliF